ncbi:helix-turn-helix domain-containing protein [Maritalea porphyrae]|jgi:IS30 family transposase|nr:helix-turn-helix domain-containing protein [Maritalea porphyrae]MCZ4271474.1 helix-turn-helix domain-containing protein [Maritalea porphyrae]
MTAAHQFAGSQTWIPRSFKRSATIMDRAPSSISREVKRNSAAMNGYNPRMADDKAQQAYILQFSGDDESLVLQLMDYQAENHFATLRVLRHISDDGETLQVGILHIAGKPAMAVVCEGP